MLPEMSFAGGPVPVVVEKSALSTPSGDISFLPTLHSNLATKHLPTLSTLLTRIDGGKKQEMKERKKKKHSSKCDYCHTSRSIVHTN